MSGAAAEADDEAADASGVPLIQLYKQLTHIDLVKLITKTFGILDGPDGDNPHRKRRAEMGERVRLYRDDGADDISKLIDGIWTKPDYRTDLKSYLPAALQENVSRRIADEVASLYDKPAVRTLKKGQQKRFKQEEKRLRLHEITQDYHRLLWLVNDVLIWQFIGVDDKTKLRVVTPDLFDAIPDPRDRSIEAGILLDTAPLIVGEGQQKQNLPHFELWDCKYRYLISAAGDLVDAEGNAVDMPIEHGLDRVPWALLHRREPSDRVLDARPGRDIAAGHRAATLYNIMILRLAKTQGERQPVLTGPVANMAKGQTANGENPLVLPPDVTASILDTRTDPDHFLKGKHECIASLCHSHGMSYESYSFAETSNQGSGKQFQMRRLKLTELRGEQRRRALVNEDEVVELIGFDPDGMKVDHQEQAVPQEAVEEMQLLDMRTRVGMDSPVKAIMRKDPDLSPEDALQVMKDNLAEWATLITMLRALNMPANANSENPGQDPQINGSGKLVQKMDVIGDLAGNQNAPANANSTDGQLQQNSKQQPPPRKK